MTGTLPTVAVVYGRGSAGPAEILGAARGLCDVVFVCDPAVPGVAPLLAGMRRRARVCEISGHDTPAAELLRGYGPVGIVTFSEYCLAGTARLAEALGLPYHRPDTVRLLTDKADQRAAFAAAGVDHTPSVVVRSAAEVDTAVARLGYPVVLKPRTGAGSQDTVRLADREQQRRALADVGLVPGPGPGPGDEPAGPHSAPRDFVVEKYLPGDPTVAGPDWGDYVSVEAVVQHAEVTTLCVTGKFALADPLRETGLFLPATLTPAVEKDAAELAAAAVRALGVTTGVTHTEVKLTPDGPRVIEVNGRVGGRAVGLLDRALGIDLLALAFALALERTVEPVTAPRPAAVTFEYFIVPPRTVGTVRAIDGADAVRALPGVGEVDVATAPGQPVDWRHPAQRLAFVRGTVATHDELLRLITSVHDRFHLEFAPQ
ncbi:ATP-grasp domain-containing protein [Kitasatospora sp. NPDC058397]|uniref:ATP-grasp domain-containing protein n=1 Tax=unclassified Kitasatospora TaxID=2633591 RepID=UPI00364D26E6